jgi:hypothetical protein
VGAKTTEQQIINAFAIFYFFVSHFVPFNLVFFIIKADNYQLVSISFPK